jgi:hypothetical protein
MEKKRTNSGPLRESVDKHSIYPFMLGSVLVVPLRALYVRGLPTEALTRESRPPCEAADR